MVHEYLTLVRKEGSQVPDADKDIIFERFNTKTCAFGTAWWDDGDITIDYTTADTNNLREAFDMIDEQLKATKVLYTFYKTDATLQDENLQPFKALEKDGELLIAASINGYLSGFEKTGSTFSREHFANIEFLGTKIDSMQSQHNSFESFFEALGEQKEEYLGQLFKDGGTVTYLNGDGGVYIHNEGDSLQEYPWGWSTEAIKKPPAVATVSSGLRKTKAGTTPTPPEKKRTSDAPLPNYSEITINVPPGNKNERRIFFDKLLGHHNIANYKDIKTYTITDPKIIQKYLAGGGKIESFRSEVKLPIEGPAQPVADSPVIKSPVRDEILTSYQKGEIKNFLDQHSKAMAENPGKAAEFEAKIPTFFDQMPDIPIDDVVKWPRAAFRFFSSKVGWENARAELFLALCKQIRSLQDEIVAETEDSVVAPAKTGLKKTKAA